MADLFDYIKWRGDIEFSYSPLNAIDALIFAQISYINFDNLIPTDFDSAISIKDLSNVFFDSEDFSQRINLGVVINPKTIDLFSEVAKTERFKKIKICGYKNKYSKEKEEQFCAFSAIFDDFILAVFRGTDDTVIGWKEDFNLAIEKDIPAQMDSLKYLNELQKSDFFKKTKKLKIAGHSKGGNLAIFSSANFDDFDSIQEVFNFDGPGFSKETLESKNFKRIKTKVKNFYPQCSIIGMLFEHFPDFEIVKSTEKLLMQHDPLSWQVFSKIFDTTDKFDSFSIFIEKTFNDWVSTLSTENKTQFVETIFDSIAESKAKDFSEFSEHLHRNLLSVVKNIFEQDSDTKKINLETIHSLVKNAGENFPELIKNHFQ